MPNWCSNTLFISGKNVQAVLDAIRTVDSEDEDERILDFNKIVPMPESLRITSGSATDYGIAVIQYDKGDLVALKQIIEYEWVAEAGIKSLSELRNYLVETGRADVEEGQKALDNLVKYGAKNWYDWSIKNWGTKWNACSVDLDQGEDWATLNFETAWSPPLEVIEQLAKLFPGYEFSIRFDEDGMDIHGTETYKTRTGEQKMCLVLLVDLD